MYLVLAAVLIMGMHMYVDLMKMTYEGRVANTIDFLLDFIVVLGIIQYFN